MAMNIALVNCAEYIIAYIAFCLLSNIIIDRVIWPDNHLAV